MKNKKSNPAFDYFYSNFLKFFEESFPLVTLSRSKANNQPWMTRGLRKTCRKRIILYQKYTRGEINNKLTIETNNDNYYDPLRVDIIETYFLQNQKRQGKCGRS